MSLKILNLEKTLFPALQEQLGHLGVVDGDIPITAIYTCASVHDSQVATPVINEISRRVDSSEH
jgi:hypothetical protein